MRGFLHRNTHLSTLRFCGIFCTTANIHTPQRMVFTPQQFTVSQRNCTKAITISPFHCPCFTETKIGDFRPLDVQKTGGTQPPVFCCPILPGRCLFCSSLKLMSYRHTTDSHFLLPGSKMSDNKIPEAPVPDVCHPSNAVQLHGSHICRASGIPL